MNKKENDKKLDEALENTFPASDPISVHADREPASKISPDEKNTPNQSKPIIKSSEKPSDDKSEAV